MFVRWRDGIFGRPVYIVPITAQRAPFRFVMWGRIRDKLRRDSASPKKHFLTIHHLTKSIELEMEIVIINRVEILGCSQNMKVDRSILVMDV